jgi:TatD DNase family protein
VAWTDSHAHLQYDGVGQEAIARARTAGVARMICIGTDAAHSASAIALARHEGEGLWATVGLHPHDATAGVATLDALWDAPEVVAVGECGLDYFYEHSPRDVQRIAFAQQIGIAHERSLALVIHTRDAWDDTFAVLASEGIPPRTIIHCFSGGPAEAERCLSLGAALSFSGIVTFKNADDVRAAAVLCPLERLLVETDAPFLAPVPHRGRTNEPAYVPLVGAAVAAAKGVDMSEVEAASWRNAERLFELAPTEGSSVSV